MRKDVDRVVHQETQVTDVRLLCLQQAVTNTGFVDIDADVVLVRVFSCLLDQCFAVPETNFQNSRCRSSKYGLQIQRFRRVLNAKHRPQGFERFLLRRRLSPGSSHKAADRTFVCLLIFHLVANSKEEFPGLRCFIVFL